MKNSITLIFLAFLAFSCSKEEDPDEPLQQDQLPPITQTGAYTFGCLLDGEVWIPKHYSNSIVNPPVVLSASWNRITQRNRFSINAKQWRKDDDSPRKGVVLYTDVDSIYGKIPLGVSFLVDTAAQSGLIYDYDFYRGGKLFLHHSIVSQNSWIQFSRFDTIARIASGTFSVDLINADNNQDTVRIREGRFDVPF
jgi:hypothetical protein